MELIRRYTREAGVRNLEREISNLARKAVKEILIIKKKKIVVTAQNVAEFLGPPKYRYGEIEADDQVGLVTGLAWTEVGGELLTIEGVMMPGKGRMTVTGNLKDVMKELISAAASYVRSRAVDFGIEPPLFDKRDIHVHVPEGATPKDGPSAGVAMATVIVSMLTGIPVRRDIAMTGEITLRGRVLPIGGLKEKLLAALRGGIKKVLIPEENVKDLAEIPSLGEDRAGNRAGLAHGGSADARARAPARSRSSGRRMSPRSRQPPLRRTTAARASSPTDVEAGRPEDPAFCSAANPQGFAAFFSPAAEFPRKTYLFLDRSRQTLAFPERNGEQCTSPADDSRGRRRCRRRRAERRTRAGGARTPRKKDGAAEGRRVPTERET